MGARKRQQCLVRLRERSLHQRQIGADVQVLVDDCRASNRFRLLNLAWEYTGDSFGARQLLFEMHNAGAQLRTKQKLAETYDAEHFKQVAKQLAGIGQENHPA